MASARQREVNWISTWWCGLIRPPGRKLRPISYPSPAQKIRQKSPSKNNAATPSPGCFSPNPVVLRLIVMLSVLETGRSVRFRPLGRKMKAIPPPPPPTNIVDFHLGNRAAAPFPGRFRPRQRGNLLPVMSLVGGIKWNSQNRPHGAKMAPVAHPPERLKYIDSPLLKAKPPRHPPAVSARANAVAS